MSEKRIIKEIWDMIKRKDLGEHWQYEKLKDCHCAELADDNEKLRVERHNIERFFSAKDVTAFNKWKRDNQPKEEDKNESSIKNRYQETDNCDDCKKKITEGHITLMNGKSIQILCVDCAKKYFK